VSKKESKSNRERQRERDCLLMFCMCAKVCSEGVWAPPQMYRCSVWVICSKNRLLLMGTHACTYPNTGLIKRVRGHVHYYAHAHRAMTFEFARGQMCKLQFVLAIIMSLQIFMQRLKCGLTQHVYFIFSIKPSRNVQRGWILVWLPFVVKVHRVVLMLLRLLLLLD